MTSATPEPPRALSYDPQALTLLAKRLYRQARFLAVFHLLRGGVVGMVIGAYLASWAQSNAVTLLATVVGSWIGFTTGRGRALQLRLQAQTALCQARIEENTRSSSRQPADS